MVCADYAYYTGTYRGTMPEDAFGRAIRTAAAYIESVTFGRVNMAHNEAVIDKIKRAECAVADVYYAQEQGGVIASASNDGYSETYQTEKSTVEQRAFNAALLYLGLTGLMYCGGC